MEKFMPLASDKKHKKKGEPDFLADAKELYGKYSKVNKWNKTG